MKCKQHSIISILLSIYEKKKSKKGEYFRLAQSVKAMLAFGIFITHGIACYVAIDLTWNKYVVERISSDRYKLLWEYVVRTVIVLITCKILLKSYRTFHFKMFAFNLKNV